MSASFGRAGPGPRPCENVPFPEAVWDLPTTPRAKTKLLFVCRTHEVLAPMAAGLARAAYDDLDIAIESAGLSPGEVDPWAVAAMAELDIDISRTPPTSVRDLKLETFEVIVSLGARKLAAASSQLALEWDIAEPERPSGLQAVREIRGALSVRLRALHAILTAAGQA